LSLRELEPPPSRWVEGAMNPVCHREELNQSAVPWVTEAMNFVCHGEERSDVAIHLKFQLDCRARLAGLAMTNRVSSLAGAQRRGDPSGISAGLPRPPSRARNDKQGVFTRRSLRDCGNPPRVRRWIATVGKPPAQ
jgi:hypothetical protein